jgi:DNA-binding response OmpR family regulator
MWTFTHRRVLVADGDRDTRGRLAAYLHDRGCQVLQATTGDEALNLISAGTPLDAAILDEGLQGRTGFEVMYLLRAARCTLPVILAIARGDPDLLYEARLMRARILMKPLVPERVAVVLADTLAID